MRTIVPALIACSLSLACREDPSGDPSEGEAESAASASVVDTNADTDDDPSELDDEGEGGGLLSGMSNPFTALLSGSLDKPGPYDPPKQSPGYADGKPHLKVLRLSGSVGEVAVFDPLAFAAGGGARLQTRTLLDELDELAAEDQLAGLVLHVGELSMDMARAKELRAGLLEFKGEGARELHCHAEGLGNTSYYLLSACDDLAMAPVGTIMLPGPAAMPVHLVGLLDKLGVVADVVHIGAFKGAAEPLTRSAPSPQMVETLEAIVDQAYTTMVSDIAAGRGKDEAEVRGWIDESLFTSEDAAARGLIDSVEPWEPYLARVNEERGWKQATIGDKPWSDPLALQRFLGVLGPKKPRKPHVALVYAVGNIIDGRGRGAVGASGEIASGQLVPVLDRLGQDDDVAAVVLRVDSGGGSARASEQIWHAVERMKRVKPVVVSMAGVAASGGYYISAGATKIYADTDTLTGSIGVVGGKLVLGKALAKLGITMHPIAKGKRATMWSPMQPWTAAERELVRASMEQTYEVFLSRVAAGRELSRDEVHAIAQGRVWTGEAARQRGLVDELGGLEQALAAAAELGGVASDVGIEVYPGDPTIKDLLGSFESLVVAQAGGAEALSPGLALVLDELAASVGPAGAGWIDAIRASLSTLTALRETTVWTVEWIQPPR